MKYLLNRTPCLVRHFTRIVCLLAMPISLSCGEGPTEVPNRVPATVRIVPAAANLAALGQTVPLVATALDERGQVIAEVVFTWASNNTAVATVDASGLVTAVGNGVATVSATVQGVGVTASAAVAVDQLVTEVRLEPTSLTFAALGETRQLAAQGVDANGNAVADVRLSWSSSDESVVTVNDAGLVTAVGNGATTVSATVQGGVTASAAVAVDQLVTEVRLEPTSLTFAALGETGQLAAQGVDANGNAVADVRLSWSSSDESVVTVNDAGLVTAVGNGATTVSATVQGGGVTASAAVAVDQLVTEVRLEPTSLTFAALGETGQLAAQSLDANGNAVADVQLSWSSSDESVVTVNDAGLVTAVGNGATTVSATVQGGGVTASAAVAVDQLVTEVRLEPMSLAFAALGETGQLAAQVFDANGNAVADVRLSWSSSDESVVTVNDAGLVTAVGNGATTVSATVQGGVTASAAVAVDQLVTEVRLEPTSLTFAALGETGQLAARGVDANGNAVADLRLSWSSSDESVVTVNDAGLVAAVGNGVATVSATAGTLVANAELTVTQIASTMSVSPSAAKLLQRGDTLRLFAEALDANEHVIERAEFTWGSSDETIAIVSADGLATAVGPGSVVITAELVGANLTGSSMIEVLSEPRAALTAFYHSTGGPNWIRNDNWLSNAPLSEWHGVTTDEHGHVTELYLRNNRLEGPLPPELASLANLRRLDLVGNGVTGQIPAELAQLDSLRVIWLSYNDLTGPIPSELARLTHLNRLEAGANQLSGPIPPELGNLTNLIALNLAENDLTGVIPSELGKLSNILLLALNTNNLTGQIPGEFAQFPKIDHLALGNTDLTGSITALENLKTLTRLTLQNTRLSGRLPEGLAKMRLREFWWNRTQLCAPANEAFQQWLKMIEDHRGGATCAP